MDAHENANITELPDDVLFAIFRHLNPKSAARTSSTCRAFHVALSEEALWRHYCHEAGILCPDPTSIESWKDYYKDMTGTVGEIWGWGSVSSERLGPRNKTGPPASLVPGVLCREIVAGWYHNVALTVRGGLLVIPGSMTEFRIEGKDAVRVSCNTRSTLVLLADGLVYKQKRGDSKMFELMEDTEDLVFSDLSAGESFSVLLANTGTVYVSGKFTFGGSTPTLSHKSMLIAPIPDELGLVMRVFAGQVCVFLEFSVNCSVFRF
jgi:hypothetical protein